MLKTQVLKITILLAALGFFYAWTGFEPGPAGDFRDQGRIAVSWLAIEAMLVSGLVMLLWGTEIADALEWTPPKGISRLVGVVLLAGGIAWLVALRTDRKPEDPSTLLQVR